MEETNSGREVTSCAGKGKAAHVRQGRPFRFEGDVRGCASVRGAGDQVTNAIFLMVTKICSLFAHAVSSLGSNSSKAARDSPSIVSEFLCCPTRMHPSVSAAVFPQWNMMLSRPGTLTICGIICPKCGE